MNLCNFKLYRWMVGGLWVLISNQPRWLKAQWLNDMIYDERGCGYHPTHILVISVEDYAK